MQAKDLKFAIRVSRIVLGQKRNSQHHVLYNEPLEIIYDESFPNDIKRKHLSVVYFIFVNDELYKIGQSSAKSGIMGAMNFYLSAGRDDPGYNRFAINALMRKELDKNKKIEIYMQYADSIKTITKGIFSTKKILVPISAKGMEQLCFADYKKIHGEKSFPAWNFQEANKEVPDWIKESFGNYIADRLNHRLKNTKS